MMRQVWAALRQRAFELTAGIILCALVVVCVKALRVALTTRASSPQDATVLAAAFAASGAAFTAVIGLVGLMLRYSIDRRTTELAAAVNERAKADTQRLRMEAAIETVKLLSTSDGSPAPLAQASAALIVLAKLGQVRLAIDLADELWKADRITDSCALSLCDTGFLTTDTATQTAAAVLLASSLPKLETVSDGRVGVVLPTSLGEGWPSKLGVGARRHIQLAVDQWVGSNPRLNDIAAIRRLMG